MTPCTRELLPPCISGTTTQPPIVAPCERELHQFLRVIDGTGSSLFCPVGNVTETAAVTAGVEPCAGSTQAQEKHHEPTA
jgi:hypothetical protein